ncbi:adenine phosphoribosyltransferase [Plakobranchus ocellatus]|uniref:Adenine phosphoribosyltransferase n=1 Tax=Plakobranchus ocellatus TaxID=259542 RepID=A0AAV4DAQ2_9GAST|nr:adenine phosphoribosyltransferase [Plakobranchus ocellatus]
MAADRLSRIRNTLGAIPDFPKAGILFRDIFPVLRDAEVFKDLNEEIFEASKSYPDVECVVGLESRGFLFGPILAQKLSVPFVPIRKKGKLPGELISQTYELEYGTDCCEIQKGSVSKGQKVLIIDDLLATGGTMKAACDLLEKLEADIVLCLCIIELTGLKGKSKIDKPFKSLITFDD